MQTGYHPKTEDSRTRSAELLEQIGLLEGTGKFLRHVKLRPGIELDEAALTDLVHASYEGMRRPLERRAE